MPAWSTDISAYMLEVAGQFAIAIDQMRLQRLVYIAHGMRLARCGEPLTGDRPEAWDYGPVYKRLADATAPCGEAPIGRLPDYLPDWSGLDESERDLAHVIVRRAGALPLERLSAITRGEGSPWQIVYADGVGRYRDIPHMIIKRQFGELEEEWIR